MKRSTYGGDRAKAAMGRKRLWGEQHAVYQYQTRQDKKRGRVTMAMGSSMRLERGG
jgi:hypothetical protein